MSHSQAFRVRHFMAVTEAGKFQEDTGESFLTVVEKLIAKILFQVDSAHQQRSHKFMRKA